MEVRGRCLREGRPRVVDVTDAEIRDALAEPLKVIVGCRARSARWHPARDRGGRRRTTASSSPAAARCCAASTSGCAQETGVPVTVADDPLTSVVRGVGQMLDDVELLRARVGSGVAAIRSTVRGPTAAAVRLATRNPSHTAPIAEP